MEIGIEQKKKISHVPATVKSRQCMYFFVKTMQVGRNGFFKNLVLVFLKK